MINIIIKSFKKQFISVSYYFIGLFLYIWVMVAMFPSMQKIDLEKLYGQFPKEFLNFFGATDITGLSTFGGFISIEFLSLFFILIVAFFVSSSAGSTIAGNIEKKTMDFSLSQPISRTKLVLSDGIVTLAYSALLVIATSASMYLLGKAYKVDVDLKGLYAFTIVATALLWSIYGIAIFFSSLLRNKITVASITLSIVMAFYVLTAMTGIIEKLKSYDKYSLFYAYNPQKLLETGDINWHQFGALMLILFFGLSASLIIFNKKDV